MRIMEPLPTEFTQVFFRATMPINGWQKKFAVVTAHNPDGQLMDPAANDAADAELRTEIEKLGLKHFRVTGGSRDKNIGSPAGVSRRRRRSQRRSSVNVFGSWRFSGSRMIGSRWLMRAPETRPIRVVGKTGGGNRVPPSSTPFPQGTY
jgi:hypothetical protein